MFELVYKQIIPPPQPYMGQNLIVRGTKIENSNKLKNEKKKPAKQPRNKSSNGIRLEKYSDKLILVRNRLREKSNCFDFSKYSVKVKPELHKIATSGNPLKKKRDDWQTGIWRNKEIAQEDNQDEFSSKNKNQHQLPFVNDTFKQKPLSPPVTKNHNNSALPKIVIEG